VPNDFSAIFFISMKAYVIYLNIEVAI